MDTILIVDDNLENLESLSEGLQKLNQFQVVTAQDGEQAIEILQSERISLLVTDIKMPKVDGLELLAYMSKKHASTPCIVMTGYGSPEMRRLIERHGVLQYIEKPFDFRKLALSIIEGLHLLDEGASMKGMSLRNFLPLVELAGRSCRLEVTSAGKGKGYLYFDHGHLQEAHYQSLRGEDAAQEMLGWPSMEFWVNDLPQGRGRGRMSKNLMTLLQESADTVSENTESASAVPSSAPGAEFTVAPDPDVILEGTPPLTPENEMAAPVAIDRLSYEAALADHLEPLQRTKGYRAVAILNFVGDILAVDAADDDLALEEWGARFTDLFRVVHEAAMEEGLGECRELTIHGANYTLLLNSSGLDAKVRFYLMSIVDVESNWYYLKMQLNEATARIAEDLA